MAAPALRPRRLALVSLHTSPLAQPGTGDAGGMNVYILELGRQLAARGHAVDLLTRASGAETAPVVELATGLRVRHVAAGPRQPVRKQDLPALVDAFSASLLALPGADGQPPYDLVHSHYWLSGVAARPATRHWGVPLVHTMHTMAAVKNAALADGDVPEPAARLASERRLVEAADRLVANTEDEAAALRRYYDADPGQVAVVPPGVDLATFHPDQGRGGGPGARARLGLPPRAQVQVLLFVGRLQPLKAPDVLVRAAGELVAADPGRRGRLVVVVLGGPSGLGTADPTALRALASRLGVDDLLRVEDPVPRPVLADWYRAADILAVPSHNESFGLVALEAQACGTPVVAARVGGLREAVVDGATGVLVDGHDPTAWADALGPLLDDPDRRARLGAAGAGHAKGYGWDVTAARMLAEYAFVSDDRSREDRP